jgi:WD40 repeat protein
MVLLLGAAGCAIESEVEAPTVTTAPTETVTPVPPTGTHTPLPTETTVPTPTEALSEDGPWLVYSHYEQPSLIIRDVSVNSVVELAPPDGRHLTLLSNQVAPDGSRFAVISSGAIGDTVEMMIYSLPDLDVEFRTTLVSEEALEYAQNQENPDSVYSIFYLYSNNSNMLNWSENRRYLAFINNVFFPRQQVILFDTQTGEQQVLYESNQWLRLIDWSPDGEYLLFFSGDQGTPYFSENGATFVVSISSGVANRLGSIANGAWQVHPLGWVNEDQLVVIDYLWEDSPQNLRLFDASLGSTTVLYSSSIGDAAFDPDSGTLVFDIWSLAWMTEPNTEPKEMQVVSLPDGHIRTLPVSNYTSAAWHPSLGLFSAESEEGFILFGTSGNVDLELSNEFIGATKIYPSPDGQYILVDTREMMELITLDGDVVHDFSGLGADKLVWLPDSSGFYFIGREGLLLSAAVDGWQPQLIDSTIYTTLFLVNP